MKERISFKDFINGHILTKGFKVKHMVVITLLVVLSMIYMKNTYSTIEILYDISMLEKEISVLRNRSIDYTVQLQELGREHEVKKLLKQKNIKLMSKKTPIIEITKE